MSLYEKFKDIIENEEPLLINVVRPSFWHGKLSCACELELITKEEFNELNKMVCDGSALWKDGCCLFFSRKELHTLALVLDIMRSYDDVQLLYGSVLSVVLQKVARECDAEIVALLDNGNTLASNV